MTGALGQLLGVTTPSSGANTALTVRVVRSDVSGVWVVAIGEDINHPIGPCRGGAGAPVGATALLILTNHAPWISNWEEGV